MTTTIKIPDSFDFLFTPSRYKISYGGRGSAKTESYAAALILKGAQNTEKIMCCREYQTSIRDSVKAVLDRKIEDFGLLNFYKIQRDSIIGRNGTEFIFAGLKQNPSKIKSTDNVTICWVEEGQTISQESLDILIPTIRADNSEIWISMNTGADDDPIYVHFIKSEVPDTIVKKVNYYDNPFFPEVLRREMEYCKQHDHEKYLWVWEGEPRNTSERSVYKNWKIGETGRPKDGVYYFGMDFGYANDPSALIKCYVDDETRTLYITEEAHGYKVEIEDLPSFIDQVTGSKDQYITADSARPETISFLRNKGYYIESSKKGPGSVMEGIEFIQNYSIIVDERCTNTIYELSRYSFKVDARTDRILPTVPEDKDNHLMDALRYALEALRNRPDYSLVVPD